MPVHKLSTDPNGTLNVLLDLALNGELMPINYFLGGNIRTVATDDETAVHPALRNAIWNCVWWWYSSTE